MKELTIEEKAKAYDEALEKLRSLHDNYDTVSTLIDIKEELEQIFPELAESEDERVRNEIIAFVEQSIHRGGGTPIPQEQEDRWIAWLEKQGESYTKRDVDNAYVEGMVYAKDELEKQKPSWSKEDKIMIANIRDDLFCYQTKVRDEDNQLAEDSEKEINWFKSLKDRYTWKPSEELDEASYQVGIKRVLDNPESYGLTKYNWKPSDEQMNTLHDVIVYVEGCNSNFKGNGSVLENLYNDLKKLTE